MNKVLISVNGSTVSIFLKKNTLFVRYRTNFLNLAKTKVLPNIGNPKLEIKDFPVNVPGNTMGNEYIEVQLQYGKDMMNENAQSIAGNIADKFLMFIDQFTMTAIDNMMSTSEFIPLSGYSFENLKEEAKAALQAKRKFILIKDYDQYLNMGPDKKAPYKFNIKVIDPEKNREEYADVFCILQKENPKEAQRVLSEKYKEQLKFDDWTTWC